MRWRTLGDDLPSVNTGAWSNINNVVGCEDSVFIVFDYDDRIAQIAKVGEGAQ